MKKPEHLVVAYGGTSPEHEVSVLTAMQAIAALESNGHTVRPLYVSKSGRWYTGHPLTKLENYQDLDRLLNQATPCTLGRNSYGQPVLTEDRQKRFGRSDQWPIGMLLLAFHGGAGENGSFQGLCEVWDLPYTGCDPLGSALGMNKRVAKDLCRAHGIPVVPDQSVRESEWIDNRKEILKTIDQLGPTVVVKPVHLGSSIGVARAANREELSEAIEEAFRYDDELLVERAIEPLMEINCSVLGSGSKLTASVCERPLAEQELLSFQDKYQGESGGKGMASATREIPADIPDEMTDRIRKLSIRIFSLLGASGVARLDFLIQRESGEVYFNEINTIPGSFSFYLWEPSGIPFPDLMERILELGLDRHRHKTGRVQSYETNLLSEKALTGLKGLKGDK
ncbi:MAG: D-alanine--D-alanine ligase family protein [Balneolaceae bacterium]